jgi:uncharacterized membrane protein YkvA (DUF1232 family)
MKISFELNETELDHYRLLMKQVQIAAARKPREQILSEAEEHLHHSDGESLPGFAADRFEAARLMIAMLRDDEWGLPESEAQRILNALVYFSEPDDLIPDDTPVLGFIDDAIMIELVIRDLYPELDAYREFCGYREQNPDQDTHTRGEQRDKLLARIRKRRAG